MQGIRALACATFGILLFLGGGVRAESPAVWAQSNDADAIEWSGAKSAVGGLIHSNGGVTISGSKNEFLGGTEYVTSFVNHKPGGGNANIVDPAAIQVSPQSFPRSYTADDFMPDSPAALEAGEAYVDLSDACLANGASGVSLSYNNDEIPDQLIWVPCDVLFDAKNSTGNVTVVSTGKVHYKTHNNAHLSAFSQGILALSSSASPKAIHLNGNKSTMHGDFVAQFGELHLAGSNQTLSCGVFADRVKISGSSLVIAGDECAVALNNPPMAVADFASTFEGAPVVIDVLENDSDTDGLIDPSTATVTTAPGNGAAIFDASGFVTYTPNAGFVGTDTFEYTVADDDGAVSQPAIVTIDVEANNSPPVAVDDVASIREDEATIINVLGNDSDSDGSLDIASVLVVDAPLNGTAVVDVTTGEVAYTPDTDFFGTDIFVYTVADNEGAVSNEAAVLVTVRSVNDAPVVQSDIAEGEEDQVLVIDVLANDSDVDSDLTIGGVVINLQPANGSLAYDYEANVLVYTPDPNFFGTDTFTYRLYDRFEAGSVDIATVSITIGSVNDVPLAPDSSVDVGEDGSVEILLQATDVEGDPVTYSVTSAPMFGALAGTAPNLTYTPAPNFSGTDSITYVASDGSGDSAPGTITINVLPVNDAPVMLDQSFDGTEDLVLALTVIATDVDGDTLIYSITSQPGNATLTGDGPSYLYTPNADFDGTDTFVISVGDGAGGTDSALITVSLASVNDAPVGTARSVTTGEDSPLAIVLSGFDVDGDTLTFAVATNPSNGVLSGTSPNLTYTPSADFNGNDAFSFTASDGVLTSAPTTIEISVSPANDAPVAADQTLLTDEDTARTVVLSATDIDGDALTYAVATQPANGSLSGIAPNLTYTPNADFDGIDTFTFTANDGLTNSAPGTITIDMVPINDAPNASDSAVSTDEDVAVSFTLAGNDVDGDILTYTLLQQPANGTLSGTAPALTYTPALNFNGNDSLTFSISDGQLGSNTATVLITVNAVNDDPVAEGQSVTTPEDTSISITLAASDPESAALTYAVVSGPGNGSLGGTAPNLLYTPAADFNGADSFAFTAFDGTNTSAPATVSIAVSPVNDAPVADALNIDAFAGVEVPVTLTGQDVDGDAVTFSVASLPANGTLAGTEPSLGYTPDLGFSGTDEFTYVANDGIVDGVPATVTINVVDNNNSPQISSVPPTTASSGAPYSYQVIASDADGDPLSYALSTAPAGMTISVAGLVEWLPGTLGSFDVVIDVSDGNGGLTQQSYSLVVSENTGPEFVRIPLLNAPVGELYQSSGLAVDPEGDGISVTLANGPAGAQLQDNGNGAFALIWPSAGDVGDSVNFEIVATDDRGAASTLNLAVLVTGTTVGRSHLGTEFWASFGFNYNNTSFGLGAMPLSDPGRQLQMLIGAPDGASGTVEVSAEGFLQPFNVAPGETVTVDLPIGTMAGADAVRVVSDTPITVAGLNWAFATTDAFLVLPLTSLGNDYLVTGYESIIWSHIPPLPETMYSIVAVQDGTTVTVTAIDGLPLYANQAANDPQVVVLNRGETYSREIDHVHSVSVVADAPVAVFAGSSCANVPNGVGTCDHLWEQFVPSSSLASRYLVAPIATRTASLYRVVANEDDTRVYINDQYVALLDRGEKFERLLTGALEIVASRPVTAVQYTPGNQFDNDIRQDNLADPFMLNIAPADAFLADYVFVVPTGEGVLRDQPNNVVRNPIEEHHVSVVIPAAAASSLILDGAPVDTSGFVPVAMSEYLAGTLSILPGTHRMAANDAFGLHVYGFGLEESYGYYAGLIFPDNTLSLALTATGPSAPLTIGSEEACIDIEVRDTGGLLIPRARYQVAVTGTVERNYTGFTNHAGTSRYCYTQPVAGTDAVTVTVSGDSELLSVEWLADTDPSTNGSPEFISLPELTLYDPTYVYNVAVADPDGDPITVTVTEGPAGAMYSPLTGQLTWTPIIPAGRVSTEHTIELTATDPGGASDTQQFELTVFYPPLATNLPRLDFVNAFGGRTESSITYIGGDDRIIQARAVAGNPGNGISRAVLTNAKRWTVTTSPMSFEHMEGISALNPVCRAPGAAMGSFKIDERFFEGSFRIPSASAGPVVDTNNDGNIDNLDDIYSFHNERDNTVRLYNLTTRTTTWVDTNVVNRQNHQPAIVNLDSDPEMEFVVPGTQLHAFDTDGTLLWQSAATLVTLDRARHISVVASDLDGDGSTELLYGTQVFDANGVLLWQSDVVLPRSTERVIAVPADLDGDGEQEVLLGDQVRDTDGTLLWTMEAEIGQANTHVMHAVADIDGDLDLEIFATTFTDANGVRMIAFDGDGTVLWNTRTQGVTNNYAGIPSIADFNLDGELEIYQPTAKTLIAADGRILSEFDTGDGGIIEQKIYDLNGDGVYEIFDGRQEYEFYLSRMLWSTSGSGLAPRFGDYNSFKYVDSDHDGKVELLITSSDGLGLYESDDGSWQIPDRDYRQHLYYDANGFNVDAYAPPAPAGLRADAWVGDLFVQGSLAGGYSFAADVMNRGTGNITEDVTVRFYRGVPAGGTFLGEVTIAGGITAGERRTVSIPLDRSEFDGLMSAELVFANPIDQCETINDTVAGTFTEYEFWDGPSEYRTERVTYIYRITQQGGDISWQTAPVPTTLTLGETFVYDADAVAPNFGDNAFYGISRINASTPVPDGVRVDILSGLVTWTPTFDQIGSHTFRVSATSLEDADSQTITIDVVPRANEAPVITTTPSTALLLLGQSFVYDVDATDADGDSLIYQLQAAPAGMTIDSVSGLVNWTPDVSQIGLFPVTVGVDDSFGGVATQSFALQVGSSNNTPPTITSVPPFTAKATFEYQYQLTVDDPDGDFIAYSVETGPAGMAIDGNGLLSWTPGAAGLEPIVVRASDGQAFADQGWTLTISDADIPLEAAISANPPVADLGGPGIELTIGYSGAAGPVSLSLTVDGVVVPVDATGVVTVPADTVGLHTATAIVTDPYASDTATVNYTVIDPNAVSSPPIVSLTSPDFEEEVTVPRDAIGSVTDPDGDLLNWALLLQSRGAGPTEFTTLASGTTEVPNGVLGQVDPTMLMNGLYSVILQATDAAGNVSQDVRVIRVTGDLKVGNFSITFEDFSAPVAGLPVTVQRTYDTRQRDESLDFGFGWSIDYQNVRLQESRDIGFSWTLIEEDLGFFSQWCVRPNGDPTVTVRMPDGEVESFVARAEPECTQIVPTIDVNIVFDPIDGTDSMLEQMDFGTVRIVGNNIVDLGSPGTPIDPDAYRLTTPEGLVFTLDQAFGIQQVEEPNGSTLTFSDAGVVHSQGFALSFVRDGAGRITSIVAPDGTSLTYAYDTNGDLESFTDQVQQTTNYTYRLGVGHYLEDIIDPRGIRVSRNEYDAEGRLIAIIDADGNRIEYDHDIIGRTETVRDRRGNPTTYIYDDDGNVLIETNALGETITRTYDADRNELSMTNDLGQTTSWTYDERGNQLTETNHLSETAINTYDDRNLLLTVVDPLGIPVMSNVYDPNNTNLLTMTDALNNTTTFHWDAGIGGGCSTGASRGATDALLQRTVIQPQCVGPFAELPLWQEDARGVRTSFGYDSLGRKTTETTTRTDESGLVQTLITRMDYDDKGRLFRVTDPEGNVTVTEYNAIDKVSATIDPNLNRTEYEYDDRGNLVLTRYPDLTTETTGFDEEGNVVSQTDRLGRTTIMVYDVANRLTETIFPDDTPGNDLDNPRTTNEYDRAGRLTATIDERGNRSEFEYDDAGRRTLVRDALLQETRFEYDARGLRTAMVDALGRRTEFVYDDAGRHIETIFPDDTPGDLTDNLRSSTGYDALGRKTSETDLAGLTTSFEYDEVGNLTAVIDALNQRTEYGYDGQSNKISQTDAELRTTSWAYDDNGRVVSRTLPESQSESFVYDDNGNRTSHTDFNGAVHTFGYDDLNRQTTATYQDGVVVTTTYTDTGQVDTITDDRGATVFGYDERDRLTSITYPNGKTIDYGYDDAGNRTSLTTANQSLSYTFDVLNRLATVTDEAGTTTYGYDAVGNRSGIDYANGTRTAYVYDSLNRLTRLDQFDTLDVLFDQHSYVLGDNGNRTQHAELNGRVVDYIYDDLYRLTSDTVTDAVLGNRTASWTYDAVGNRLSQVETDASGTDTTTYVYDLNDRLLSETVTGVNPDTVTYSYDNNGNTLTRTDGAGTTTYTYDSRNRLSNLNSGQTTYLYDASGIRMSETSSGLTTHYLTDPNRDYAQVLEESFDLNAFAEVRYTYGDDLVAQHRRVDATTTTSSTYHYDGIGSTRALTDISGGVTDTYAFTAFGETEGTTGITVNDYLYTGEQFDPNLGFYYLRARYYSPGVGRFATMDTFMGRMFEPITLHKYLYANVDPISFVDPSGLVGLTEQSLSLKIQSILRGSGSRKLYLKATKKVGCLLIEAVAEEAITSGVYLLLGTAGPYVGRSVDIARRVQEHVGVKIESIEDVIAKVGGNADTDDLRILEQFMMDQVEAESIALNDTPLTNRRKEIAENPRSKRSKNLRSKLNGLKLCKK